MKGALYVNYRPIPSILLCLVLGIIIAYALNLIWGLIIVAFLFCIFLIVTFKNHKWRGRVIFLFIFFIIGFSYTASLIQYNLSREDILNAQISGRVYNVININTVCIENVSINGKKVNGKMIVSSNLDDIKIGDIINANNAKVEILKINKDELHNVYYRSNVVYNATVDNIEIIRGSPNFKYNYLLKVKETLSNNMGADEANASYAMLYGDKQYISSAYYAYYKAAGVLHLFAVSGLHTGILAGFVLLMLKAFKANRYLKLIITPIVLLIYAYLCDFSPPILRATLMITIYLAADCLSAYKDTLSIICLSAIIMILIKPLIIVDLSYAMSFISVLSIIFLYPYCYKLFSFLPTVIRVTAAISLAVNIGLFPVYMIIFGYIATYYMVVNLLILPFMAIIFIALLMSSLVSVIIPSISAILVVPEFFIMIMNRLCNMVHYLPFSVLKIGNALIVTVAIYVSVIFLSKYVIKHKNLGKGVFILLLAFYSLLHINLINSHFIKKESINLSYSEQAIVMRTGDKNYAIFNKNYKEQSIDNLIRVSNIKEIDSVIKLKEEGFSFLRIEVSDNVNYLCIYNSIVIFSGNDAVIIYNRDITSYDFKRLIDYIDADTLDNVYVLYDSNEQILAEFPAYIKLVDIEQYFTIHLDNGIIIKKWGFISI